MHIDGVLRLSEPDRDPEAIKAKRTYAQRTRYFARNELSRLCRESLRDSEQLSTDDIVTTVKYAKGFDRSDTVLRGAPRAQLLMALRAMRKRGAVEQRGFGHGVSWRLPI
jgi:RNase P protein component